LKRFRKIIIEPVKKIFIELAKNNRIIKVLELGGGTGNFPKFFLPWATKNRIKLDYTFTEKKKYGLNCAMREVKCDIHTVKFKQIDAVKDLDQFHDKEFDLVIVIQMIHHFIDDDMIIQFLKDIARIAKVIFIYDNKRCLKAVICTKLCLKAVICTKLYLTLFRACKGLRHDGVLSMKKSFTFQEMKDIVRKADLNSIKVIDIPVWELVTFGWT
jgi:ubiquinone/menaquinone biosynthesis C-methylase UbiE